MPKRWPRCATLLPDPFRYLGKSPDALDAYPLQISRCQACPCPVVVPIKPGAAMVRAKMQGVYSCYRERQDDKGRWVGGIRVIQRLCDGLAECRASFVAKPERLLVN